MFQLLIVDDDKNIRKFLSTVLSHAGYKIFHAISAGEALHIMEKYKIDLIILDIMLPGMDGYAFAELLRGCNNDIPILMLSAKQFPHDIKQGFLSGTDDYMTKPFSMVVLGKRITALLRRAGVKDELNIWKYGELTVDFSGYSACNQNGKINITPKEIELLKLLLDHKGLVLSRSQILNAVWGDDTYVIDRIVDSYIRNLRKKLELNCIATVKGIGYKLEVDV